MLNEKVMIEDYVAIRHQKTVIVLMLSFIIAGCSFYFNTTTDQFTTKSNTDSFERGKNLVFAICAGCHYDPKVGKFIGRDLNDLPKIAGHLYSANLTQSKNYGIPPHYTDAELFYLLKTGISKSGKFTPYMMKPMMADEDINDIILYLRSNDPAVASADTTVGKTHINVIGKAGIRFVMGPQPYNKGVQRPDENNPVEYGRYLVAVIGCYHCHSKKVLGVNFLDAEKTKGYLQGGIKLKDPNGKRLYGPNLTPDNETGIGSFTEPDFQKAIQEGIIPSGEALSPPMGKFKSLTQKQVQSIYAYLRSLKAVHHAVKGR
jgi:mono/diheme cytochrome c family protein